MRSKLRSSSNLQMSESILHDDHSDSDGERSENHSKKGIAESESP